MFKVTKAQIEKAEVKANMTKERLEIAQELAMERDRGSNLEKTVRLLREQSDDYEVGRPKYLVLSSFHKLFYSRNK